MSILKVARLGHPVLREKARPVAPSAIVTPEVQKLIDDMIETMQEYHGVGLAAPQVHESVRIFVAGIEEEDPRTGESEIVTVAVVNPEITPIGRTSSRTGKAASASPTSGARCRATGECGCKGSNRDGKPLEMELEDFRRGSSSTRTTT